MLQGARYEHAEALRAASQQLGIEVEVIHLKMGKQVDSHLDCLVLPGGESTAMRKASESESLLGAIYAWMDEYPLRPVLGTCAGAILLAQPDSAYEPFIRTGIARNAWGRQRDSFEHISLLLRILLLSSNQLRVMMGKHHSGILVHYLLKDLLQDQNKVCSCKG